MKKRVYPSEADYSNHSHDDHVIGGSPHELMRQIMARHLCAWITGHSAPLEHFLVDADMILEEAHEHGVRFHLAGATANTLDGFAMVRVG